MKEGSIAVCVFIAVAFFCEWISVKVDGADASFATLHGAAKLIEFCVAPTMGFVAAYSYSDIKRSQVISVVIVIHTLFEFIAFKNQWVFYVDANNIYHRASLYWVYIVVFSLSSIYCFVSVLNEERKYYAKFDIVLVETLLFLAFGIGIQMVEPDIRVDYLSVAIGNFLLYNHRCKMIFQLDGLTHLLNRRCYEKDIEKINSPIIIFTMDVNKFKMINDTYGHTAGDYYLKAIADTIRKIYGKFGNCYRYGGDEFCVILSKNLGEVEQLNNTFITEIRKQQNDDDKGA